MTWSVRWLAGLLLGFSVVLAGCSEPELEFNGSDIAGAGIGESWELVDFNGQTVTPASYQGKVSLVFFGFTQCPDICPTALADVSQAVSLLGDDAQSVQVLMVSVDPERDTPEILQAYLGAFDAELPTEFVGLAGTTEQIRQAAGSFRAYYAKAPTPDGSYTMDHSTSFYLMDQDGKARVLLSNQVGPQAIADDIRTLLQN
ncbi:SCO family protein [Orrella marina]|uniref:SCO family protein n=1 Tax=Orrella marina TaxID=2163011 RepID=A0A2R4XQ32_9BURK|nr:SCO family protein [Orrella marina]AWB35858.1 SCO family protein [Orrella marina]